MGRPTLLTPKLSADVVAYVRKGIARRTAAAACGISKNLIKNWEDRGDAGEEPYASFAVALQEAAALFVVDTHEAIRGAQGAIVGERGADPWQAHAWLLERRDPESYCLRINQHKRETEESILAKLRANPKLHEEVARVLAEEDPAAGADRPQH